MKTLALLVMARMALAWICVLGGSTPFARRVMIDLGSVRSCRWMPSCQQLEKQNPECPGPPDPLVFLSFFPSSSTAWKPKSGHATHPHTSIVTGPPSLSLSLSFLSADAGWPDTADDSEGAASEEAGCGIAGGARALAIGVVGFKPSSTGVKCACEASLLRGDIASLNEGRRAGSLSRTGGSAREGKPFTNSEMATLGALR